MVISRLIGGLGNQMFQYAAGRSLANRLNTIPKLDILSFKHYKLRKYSLSCFNIKENIASYEEINKLTVKKMGVIERILNRLLNRLPKEAPTYIKEKRKFHFDPEILCLPDNVYLEGSWQNKKYFDDIEAIIRKEFTVKTPLLGRNKELAGQIASHESVSLHIRRTDYISNPHIHNVHGTCDLDYYFRCVEYLSKIVKQPHFFIFSDEPQWVSDHLKLSYPATLIDHNGPDMSHEDLRLMSFCKHNVIANSTFSWWGAWLNENPEKIVLAPKRWFKSDDYDPIELLPDKWIKI